MVLLVKFHLNQQQSLVLSVLMAPKNKEIWSSSVSAAPEPGQAQPQAHFGCQEWLNQVSPALLLVAKLLNTDTDLDPAAQKLLIFPPLLWPLHPGWEMSSSAGGGLQRIHAGIQTWGLGLA